MKVNVAHLTYSDESAELVVEATTTRNLLLEEAGDWCFGVLCSLSNNNWSYAIRWGPKDPEYDVSFHSLGSVIFNFAQRCALWGNSGRKPVASFPVTREWVSGHFPDSGWLWDGSDDEDLEESSHDG
jgi:hypothetical protein